MLKGFRKFTKLTKFITEGMIVALFLLLLVGCSGDKTDFPAAQLLQGNLDLIYQGVYSPEYLEMTNLSEEQAQTAYENALATEAETFAEYFDIDKEMLSEATQSRIIELYRQIYAKSSYEIGAAAKDNGETESYSVQLTVNPLDIIQNFMNEDSEAFIAAWQARLDSGEFDGADAATRNEAWTLAIINLLEARLDSIGYLDAETIVVHISQNADGEFAINSDDFAAIDKLIIKY